MNRKLMQPVASDVIGMSAHTKAEAALSAAGWIKDVYGWRRGPNVRRVRVASTDVRDICLEIADGLHVAEVEMRL